MAIVINGSGTITGISVGGLPDGVVDSGTLATNSVDSAELIDGAVDNSHLATGIDAIKLADGTVTSTELQYINTLASNAQTQIDGAGFTRSTTVATTSGTVADITGIASGTNVVHVSIDNVNTSVGDILLLQIGDSGGIETSGYGMSGLQFDGASSMQDSADSTDSSAGITIPRTNRAVWGVITCVQSDSLDWVFTWSMWANSGAQPEVTWGGGYKGLAGSELDRIRLTTVGGTATFTTGQINVVYG